MPAGAAGNLDAKNKIERSFFFTGPAPKIAPSAQHQETPP